MFVKDRGLKVWFCSVHGGLGWDAQRMGCPEFKPTTATAEKGNYVGEGAMASSGFSKVFDK